MQKFYLSYCQVCDAMNFIAADKRRSFPYQKRCVNCGEIVVFNEMSDLVSDETEDEVSPNK